jgi:UDP-2,3-diacylglucosamine hydrolase
MIDKKIYFASDFHLGAPNREQSMIREKKIVSWLNSISHNVSELYLVGDIFDFWFEYKHVIPKGFIRLQGKLAEMADCGVIIHIFTGNHDLWMKQYFNDEFGAKIYYEPIIKEYDGKQFYIGHGDGLGPGDNGYKFLKKVFTNPLSNWMFKHLHPDVGIGLADFFSKTSRAKTGSSDEIFLGNDKEWLIQHCYEVLKTNPSIDYFIFGHRHYPIQIKLEPSHSLYTNLGDWLKYNTYSVWNGTSLELLKFEQQ